MARGSSTSPGMGLDRWLHGSETPLPEDVDLSWAYEPEAQPAEQSDASVPEGELASLATANGNGISGAGEKAEDFTNEPKSEEVTAGAQLVMNVDIATNNDAHLALDNRAEDVGREEPSVEGREPTVEPEEGNSDRETRRQVARMSPLSIRRREGRTRSRSLRAIIPNPRSRIGRRRTELSRRGLSRRLRRRWHSTAH